MAVLPAAASGIALALAVRCAMRARATRSIALGVWAFALAQFACATAAFAWGAARGWSAGLYRTYFLFGGVLNVAWLGLGTIWLLASRRRARVATLLVVAATVAATWLVLTSPVSADALRGTALPSSTLAMPATARALAAVFSSAGSLVVVTGLVWSMLRRRRHVTGLALVTAGVIAVAAASPFARSGSSTAFSALVAGGVALMYAGFGR